MIHQEVDVSIAQLSGLEPREGLSKCEAAAEAIKQKIAGLEAEFANTPRGDKQGAHAIRTQILTLQSTARRVRPLLAAYRAAVDLSESRGLWRSGVRAVCGDEALRAVIDWIKAEKKRRHEEARSNDE